MAQRFSKREIETLERIAYEEELITTRLNPGTLKEKAHRLRPRMIKAAQKNQTLTYSEVTNGFSDLVRFDVGAVLGLIGLVEDAENRPLLPAVVVQSKTGWPGHNYFSLVKKTKQVSEKVPPESDEPARRQIWEKHRDQVWEFDWKV